MTTSAILTLGFPGGLATTNIDEQTLTETLDTLQSVQMVQLAVLMLVLYYAVGKCKG